MLNVRYGFQKDCKAAGTVGTMVSVLLCKTVCSRLTKLSEF